ncbi:carboxypeptidase-like regulatory domain-containing protein, partial [Brucella sp. 21LCYQ03]|nr:carboxypeptidase-like regulatory domain-containing protein [Brucella sp. 21LCYQ03]
MFLFMYLMPLQGHAQIRNIPILSGVVYDGQVGKPLPLANVYIDETQQQTRTDKDGKFTISLSAYNGDITLTVSYIGKKTIKQKIAKDDINKSIVITLVNNSLTLEQVDVNPIFEGTKNSISSIT